MKRTNKWGTPEGWTYDFGPELVMVAEHAAGDVVQAHLLVDTSEGALRLRVARYEHTFPKWATDLALSPPPIVWLEAEANRAGNAMVLLDMRHDLKPGQGEMVAMRLPVSLVRGRGRKPDSFYERVLALVAICEQHGIPYGPRLAADNEVEQNTVFRWVKEARRRQQIKEQGK